MSLLTRAADRLVELVVPHTTASATDYVYLYCACWGGVKWYAQCQDLGGKLLCGGCNLETSQSC